MAGRAHTVPTASERLRTSTIDSVSFAESGEQSPGIRATLTMNALTYDQAPAASREES